MKVDAFVELVAARRGHFRLESGHHGALWLDLDALFAESRRIAPFVAALANRIRPYDVSAVARAAPNRSSRERCWCSAPPAMRISPRSG
ncbi:MAG: hypothetical protein M3303_08225 [Gemmatimonadota bacterium]|nr:hypothetical protein [Gemmatimonadota bacterium]